MRTSTSVVKSSIAIRNLGVRLFRICVFISISSSLSLSACADSGRSDQKEEISRVEGQVISSSKMMKWIEEIESQGIRLPGYQADIWIEQWLRDQFQTMGLEDITLEPIEVVYWKPKKWMLQIWHENDPSIKIDIPSWLIPLSSEAPDLQGELVYMEKPGPREKGKIAVVDIRLFTSKASDLRDKTATWTFDPDHEVDDIIQTWPLGPRWQDIMDPDIEAGAIGFIGVLDYPWETNKQLNPYDAKARDIPGLYISRADGKKLKELLQSGKMQARIVVEREQRNEISHNVTAVLPGKSDAWVIIGSHHDGPWNSAVEDASGTALVLAQAQYWSQIPKEKRPHNLMFLLNGGHMSGGAGLKHFVKNHEEFLKNKVVAEIHLEHAAREARIENGKLVPTEKPELRWWFTSFIPELEESVAKAICEQKLGRSMIMPNEGFPAPNSKHPPTDAAFFHPIVPIVSFLTAPMYLFDPADRLEMVHEPSLVPITRAVISIVEDLGKFSASDLRGKSYIRPRPAEISVCNGDE